MSVSSEQLKSLESSLLNHAGNVPLHNRFRSLFTLKSLKNDDAVRIISQGYSKQSNLDNEHWPWPLRFLGRFCATQTWARLLPRSNEASSSTTYARICATKHQRRSYGQARGSRSNGRHILLLIPSDPQRIPHRFESKRARNLWNCDRQDWMG